MSLEIANKIFDLREISHHNLRHLSQFIVPPVHNVYNAAESAACLGPKIRKIIPSEIKNTNFFAGFK